MCKISDLAAEAFLCGKPFKDGATVVQKHTNGCSIMVLYGHQVAQIDAYGFFETEIGNADSNTQTTRDRLNAIWVKAIGKKPYRIAKSYLFFDGKPITVQTTAHYNPHTKSVHLESNVPTFAI